MSQPPRSPDPSPRLQADSRQRLGWLALYTTFNAVLAIAIAAGNIPWLQRPGGLPGLAYLGIALPGHFLFFGAVASGLPLLLLRLRRQGAWVAVAMLCQGLWLALLLVDAKVYALYRFHLNAMVLNLVFGGALGDQVQLSAASLLRAGAAALALAAVQWGLARLAWRWLPADPRPLLRRGLAAALAVMAGGQLVTAWGDARGDRAVIGQWTYLPWAQPITARRQLHRLGVQTVQQHGLPPVGPVLRYPAQPLRCQSHSRPNVLMVVIESLRADALDPQVMPVAWQLAARSRVYTRHISTGNATRYGVFGLLYGLPGSYWQPMLAEQRGSVLFDVLGQQGYRQFVHASAPLHNPEFDRTAFAAIRDRLQVAPGRLPVAERDAHVVQALRRDILAAGDHAWFGLAMLDASHAPYHLPPGQRPLAEPMAASIDFLALSPGHDPAPERNRYLTAVHYADSLLTPLLQAVEESGQAGNTIILVTGDHGEEFNDLGQNYWGHNGNFADPQVQVPFVLYWPGQAAGRDARASSHMDWVPTLLRHGLGCENPASDYSTGEDLLAAAGPARPLPVDSWSQQGIRDGAQIHLFDRFGNTETVDARYRPLPGHKPSPEVLAAAWEQMTRFRGP